MMVSKEPFKLRLLVIGSGAREHTLVWKLLHSDKVDEVYVAPGNAGTAQVAKNLPILPTAVDAIVQAAKEKKIDLVLVGPEASLALGIVDVLQSAGIPTFGPTQEAALIESSKVFAKALMQKYGIPCAESESFSSFREARYYIEHQPIPVVVKADGLAAGKGSIVAESQEKALKALSDIMQSRIFGASGERVVIEEHLRGREVSLLAFTDGKTVVPMVPACDYKPAFDGDQGPNTGGMGGYSPPSFFNQELIAEAKKAILEPAMQAMAAEGKPYKGVLYAGLILTPQGLKVLEFNARFGDPESQVTLPLLKTDLVDILFAVVNGNLDQIKVEWSNDACVGVVLASSGYPGSYKTGFPISGLDLIAPEIIIFHAGTKLEGGGVVTAGGRVLTVVATGKTIAEAREKVYSNLPRIHFEGCHYRRDIAAEVSYG
jgi:phosphoribosylamine--glycine ligase